MDLPPKEGRRQNPGTETGSRLERLLDLVASLLHMEEPVPFSEIREWFPGDYGEGGDESGRRKFERDKADLLEMGIPLRQGRTAKGEEGYLIDRAHYFLPELALGGEELAVLLAAGGAALAREDTPWRSHLQLALRKLTLGADVEVAGDPRGPGGGVLVTQPAAAAREGLATDLEVLQRALLARKRLGFLYRARSTGETTPREVEPYGLYLRGGRWYLVGQDRAREAIRVFLVERMQGLTPHTERPKTPDFDPPEGFSVLDWMRRPPWRHEVHAPVEVHLEVRPDMAWRAERAFGVAAEPGGAGWSRLRVRTTHATPILEWVLHAGAWARIAQPEELRERARGILQRAVDRHGGRS